MRHESLILDGIDDHVRLSQVAPLPIYENNQFTVAFWVKGPPQDGVVYSKGVSADEGLFLVGADTNGRVRIFIEDDDDELSEFDVEETSSAVAFDNTWHHIAFTWDGDDAHLYIDGQEDSHYFNLSPNIDLTRSTVGARRDGNGTCCYFAGEVDEVFFRSFTLSAGRVLELYASTLELQTEQLPSGETEISLFLNQDPNQPARLYNWLAGITATGGCEVTDITTVGTDAEEAAQYVFALPTSGPGNEGVISLGLTSYFQDGEVIDPTESPHKVLRFRLRPTEPGCIDCTVLFKEGLQYQDQTATNTLQLGSLFPQLSDPIQTQVCGCFESQNIGGWGVSNLLAVDTDGASRHRDARRARLSVNKRRNVGHKSEGREFLRVTRGPCYFDIDRLPLSRRALHVQETNG